MLFGTLLACAVAGCSDDPNDILISHTISVLRGTTTDVEQVTKTLGDAVTTAKKRASRWTSLRLTKPCQEAGRPQEKRRGYLQQIKAQTELRKESITPEQKEEYSNKHKAFFQNGAGRHGHGPEEIGHIDARGRCDTEATPDAVEKAKAIASLGKLREKLKEAEDEFEVLTKRQT